MPSGHAFPLQQANGRDGKKQEIGQPGDGDRERDRHPQPEKLVNCFLWAGKKVNHTLRRGDDKAEDPSDRWDGEHSEEEHPNKDFQCDAGNSKLCAVTGEFVN